jgi:dTDP-4-dehydrorhamnose 3,5-epimerase
VRCVTGALYDVIVDIRPDSPTHLQSFGVELTAENGRALYVPKGFAHGFLTLLPDTTASYMVDEFYTPDAEGGLRYDDPALGLGLARGGPCHFAQGRGLAPVRP